MYHHVGRSVDRHDPTFAFPLQVTPGTQAHRLGEEAFYFFAVRFAYLDTGCQLTQLYSVL
jgi:hypothetical protein